MQPTASLTQKVENILDYMQEKRVSLKDLLSYILDGQSPRCSSYRRRVFDELESTLARIDRHKRGREILRKWTLSLACKTVDREMRKVKGAFTMKTTEITPDFVEAWSFSGLQNVVKEKAPTLCELLCAGVQTGRARNKGKKDPMVVISVIVSQMAHHRSHYAMQFQALLGIFWWSSGASRQSIHTLQRCGLSISYDSINHILSELSPKCLAEAQPVAQSPHLATYDNINISISSFYEQREDAPSKVQSGTVAVLYKLRNASPDHTTLQELLKRDREGRDLHFAKDIQPSLSQLGSIQRQLSLHVIGTLARWAPGFLHYKSHPDLQHEQRRFVPQGHKTEQFPLRVSTIEENSIKGNIAVLHNIYIDQLGLKEDDFTDLAIPCINDQSTNARIRGAKAVRADDVNSFTRIQCFQLAPGLFHMLMNLLWAILHVHRGSINCTGSLAYWFSVLDRKRLSSPQPDFHTLRSSLFQILDGLLLACWTTELNKRGHPSFASFAASQPSPGELHEIATEIVSSYAKPDDTSPPPPPRTKKAPNQKDETASRFRNITTLIRDLLYVRELSTAISSGDWGRIEDILGTLAILFKGAGANNYCTEILHLIRNLKVVWTPEFAEIIRDNMLINMSGIDDQWMGVDMNIEHLINFLKVVFTSKGVHGSWDRLGDISAASNVLRATKKRLGQELKTIYRGRTHKVPDLSKSVWKVSQMATEMGLLDAGSPDDPIDIKYGVVDVLETGEKFLKSSTLESFNKKSRSLAAGILTVDDDENAEELPAYFSAFTDDDGDVGLVFPSDIFETSGEDDDSGQDDGGGGGDDEDDDMSDSDTLLED